MQKTPYANTGDNNNDITIIGRYVQIELEYIKKNLFLLCEQQLPNKLLVQSLCFWLFKLFKQNNNDKI